MAEEIAIEIARVVREGITRAQERMRQQQLGACFTHKEQEHEDRVQSD